MIDPTQSAPSRSRRQGAEVQSAGSTDPTAPSLFDPVTRDLDSGRRLRDDGVRQASANTWGPWRVKAEAEVRRLAATGKPFSSDDVLEAVGEPPLSSKNATPAVMRTAASRGEIRRVGSVQSRRPAARARWISQWVGAS